MGLRCSAGTRWPFRSDYVVPLRCCSTAIRAARPVEPQGLLFLFKHALQPSLPAPSANAFPVQIDTVVDRLGPLVWHLVDLRRPPVWVLYKLYYGWQRS